MKWLNDLRRVFVADDVKRRTEAFERDFRALAEKYRLENYALMVTQKNPDAVTAWDLIGTLIVPSVPEQGQLAVNLHIGMAQHLKDQDPPRGDNPTAKLYWAAVDAMVEAGQMQMAAAMAMRRGEDPGVAGSDN